MSNCTSQDRVELDLYFRIACERFEPAGPLEAREARLRKEEVLRKRSPRAHQALMLARETLRRLKPADALVLLPKTTVACLALLEALNAEPELTLDIRKFNPWEMLGPQCMVGVGGVAGGGGGSGAGGSTYGVGGNGAIFSGDDCAMGACGGSGSTGHGGTGVFAPNPPASRGLP